MLSTEVLLELSKTPHVARDLVEHFGVVGPLDQLLSH